MKTKLLICGRSGCGKDYLTNYLCKEFGLTQLLSYATRPRRFKNEDTHIFISDSKANEIIESQSIIAYTQIGDYKYFGTYGQFLESDIYIIDKQGVDYLKHKCAEQLEVDDIRVVVIYVHTSMHLRQKRATDRNKDIETFITRSRDEHEQFSQFEANVEYDWFVNNNDGDNAKKIIKEIVKLYL